MPDRLHFAGDDAADTLLANNSLPLLIGFALDEQVPVQTAFSGPRKLGPRPGYSTVSRSGCSTST